MTIRFEFEAQAERLAQEYWDAAHKILNHPVPTTERITAVQEKLQRAKELRTKPLSWLNMFSNRYEVV